jgi:hypothetical protein
MTVNELLKQGIAACKAGRKAEARALLEQVIEQDDHNEAAWLWMSGAVDTDEDRQICLENVLTINPDNELARRGLERLAQSSPQAPQSQPASTPEETSVEPPAEPSPLAVEAPLYQATPEPSPLAAETAAYQAMFEPSPVAAEAPLYQATPEPSPVAAETPLDPATPEPSPVAAETAVTQATLPSEAPPPPASEAAPPTQAPREEKKGIPTWWWVGGGIVAVMVLLLACAVFGLTLGDTAKAAGTPTPEPDHRSAIVAAIQENIAAHNAEDADRYMATIHSDAPGRMATRLMLQQSYKTYDLSSKVYNLKLLALSEEEARVSFTLVTEKISGPAFRDNRVDGVMILRPDKGAWKLYGQENDDITYLD